MKNTTGKLEVGKPIDYETDSPCIASVLASRVAIFHATKKSIHGAEETWEAKTKWGSVAVRGRLTQTHRSVLDAIFAFPLASSRYMENGKPGPAVFLISPYQIAKKAGVDPTKRKWLEDVILEELRVASVVLKNEDGETLHAGGIVSEWHRDEKFEHRGIVGETSLIRITISAAWMKLMDETLGVRYAHLVEKIGKIHNGPTQALIRFLITHNKANYKLKEALAWIGAIRPEMTRQAVSKTIKDVVANKAALLDDFGISVEQRNDVWFVQYSKHKDVMFTPAC